MEDKGVEEYARGKEPAHPEEMGKLREIKKGKSRERPPTSTAQLRAVGILETNLL